MSQESKAELAAEIKEKFKAATMAILTEYRGLTVAQMASLRSEIRQVSGEYKVIKNTLVRFALKDTPLSALECFLNGPNGWVLGYEDPIVLSKVLVKFAEKNDKLTIKGGFLEGELLDQTKVKDLAKMPSKPEIQAKLLALLQAPGTQLVRLIQEPGTMITRLLDTLRKAKESS